MKISNMITEETKETHIEIIPIVNKFADVFPEYLIKLPPERKVKFISKYILVRVQFLYLHIVRHQKS